MHNFPKAKISCTNCFEFSQVDLGDIFVLTGVATQGRNNTNHEQYIKKYYVGYSSDGKNFEYLKDENGNIVVSIDIVLYISNKSFI